MKRTRRAALATKRAMDLPLGSAALASLSPVMGGITVLELVYHGWPPWFVQARPGYRGRIFHIYKFRTMTDERGANGKLLPEAQRLTTFGKFLRRTSLDELPELVNVVRGEMSLVGPRPLLVEYLPVYTAEQMRRHDMPPGMTGWAAVRGRESLTWEEKFELDVWYVDNWSLALDIRILIETVLKVLRREGVQPPQGEVMRKFTEVRSGGGSNGAARSLR